MSDWDKLYSPQNLNLIRCLRQKKDFDAIIEIHEKQPVNLLIDEPIIFPDRSANNKSIWEKQFGKERFIHLLKKIEQIEFGQIILRVRDFQIIEIKSYFRIRLQGKK